MKKLLFLLSATALISSCEIDRLPKGSMDTDGVAENPQALITGAYAQLKAWSDPMHRAGEYAGDNMMIRGSSTDAFYEFISFSRTPNNYRLSNFWDYSYKAIAQASNAMKFLKEGESVDVDNQIGECYFIRGLMYFYLVRAYGRPYYQSPETNLGLPIVNGTPEDPLGDLNFPDRATVKETYEQIIADLTKAETLLTLGKGNIYATKESAQAILSRVYLYMSGTYEKPNTQYAKLSAEYADKVINSGKFNLLSRAEFMRYNTFTPENNKETIFAVKRVASEFSGSDHYYGVGGMYANIGGQGWGEMYASAKYIDLLNETGRNDWRPDNQNIVDARAAFIEPTYDQNGGKYTEVFRYIKQDSETSKNYMQDTIIRSGSTLIAKEVTTVNKKPIVDRYTMTPVDASQGIYSIKHKDGRTYTGVLDYYISLNRAYPQFYIVKASREGENSHLHSPVITRLGEVYLNRAEANAKQGKYAEALADLNRIRTRSIEKGAYTSLSAANASERIDKERQLELAFQAERSYDVFRNGASLTRDYPGPQEQKAVIAPTDYRVIYYIPQTAIDAYPGQLTQNPTQ
ncbi:RagB/SusD family nutrient uptake outer membrane protein [Sphingobacterium sp. DK4209]|uniref:RagB/SusD family nutrient uptake outer membrane protein n=1 Tax=Sphingobacterium zhuxiongii TaxID=2662364 RepID=A0A5Q0QDW3_9SPHI|nr:MULTISPECIES: RagB/SusD family nutrient uptake outer membrane protein [unclassified Sphingobacterium]MVZ65588.1 RagB/SusD family nutrient uptake outer membrane protein [Sphingobacterium sp. DK4209]QGA27713.1 RagB/SusD family nutrient uptake outer membrane protein [Sphingobacterium sp. dk4302]